MVSSPRTVVLATATFCRVSVSCAFRWIFPLPAMCLYFPFACTLRSPLSLFEGKSANPRKTAAYGGFLICFRADFNLYACLLSTRCISRASLTTTYYDLRIYELHDVTKSMNGCVPATCVARCSACNPCRLPLLHVSLLMCVCRDLFRNACVEGCP